MTLEIYAVSKVLVMNDIAVKAYFIILSRYVRTVLRTGTVSQLFFVSIFYKNIKKVSCVRNAYVLKYSTSYVENIKREQL